LGGLSSSLDELAGSFEGRLDRSVTR